jgi:hypothetical protein
MVLRGREARDETIAVDGSFARSSEKLRACIALIGRQTKRTFHCPCRFRAVSAALRGTSRVRSHLPRANYIRLR